MKKLLLLIPLVFVLTGCLDDPLVSDFPDVPKELKEACPALKQVDPKTTKLSVIVDSVIDNYSTYHECQIKVDEWIEWYNTQKKIYDNIN
jgi:hypothetical protein